MPSNLSPRQMAALRAACDALIPSVAVADDPYRFYATSASDLGVPERVAQLIGELPNARQQAEIRLLLTALASPLLGAAITRQPRPFTKLSLSRRTAILRRLATSKLLLERKGFQALKRLATFAFYTHVPADGQPNPAWPAMGYPGPLDTPPAAGKLLTLTKIERDTTLDCDAVVVGSGAGGGVVAAKLAAAGKSVIVLEMGGYFAEKDFSWYERDGLRDLYLDGGMCHTRDLGVVILAGRCLGGGTTINYTTSFATPTHVREEWARQHGLPGFLSADYDRALAYVCERSGVNTNYNQPSGRETKLQSGLQQAGYHNALMPRNVRGCSQAEDCGYCVYGCRHGAKQGTLKTFLQDANDAGARIIVNCRVERVTQAQGRATGVDAVVHTATGDHRLRVNAKAVVVAAGSIHSPAILLRSGLRNPNIGRHLRLHPCTAVWGRFADEVRPWGGVMQAVYSDEFADQDGRGYGVKLETAPIHPTVFMLAGAWEDGRQHKQLMSQLAHAVPVGLLTRDLGSGRVMLDHNGQPVVDYRVDYRDWTHIRYAIEGAARTIAAAGATEVFATHSRYVSWRPGTEPLVNFMRRIDAADYGPGQMGFLSYHQMATCRMGSDRRRSVINQHNESHDLPGLFVADASAFPTASGVNPMITIMAIAAVAGDYISTTI